MNSWKVNVFVVRLITLFEGCKWYLIVRWSVFRIQLKFVLYFELDTLLLLIQIFSCLYKFKRPAGFINFAIKKWCHFLAVCGTFLIKMYVMVIPLFQVQFLDGFWKGFVFLYSNLYALVFLPPMSEFIFALAFLCISSHLFLMFFL